MAAIWLNGDILDDRTACLSVHDRGFTLGDGVFETLRARGSRLLWLADHLARLHAAAACLGIACPFDDGAIADGLSRLAAGAAQADSAVRLTLTRGPSARRGLWPSGGPARPTMMATLGPLPAPRSLRLVVARSTRRNEHSPLSRHKTLNYGDNLVARQEAASRGADDAIMLNGAGRVACATVGNIFLLVDGAWITPPLDDGVLAGLARMRLMPRLPAREVAIDEARLRAAQAACVSNSLGCAGVTEIDGRALERTCDARDFDAIYV
jgi:branched-subunit amino acid aminotransferase/4-amino-4-deoxychorismate lyase